MTKPKRLTQGQLIEVVFTAIRDIDRWKYTDMIRRLTSEEALEVAKFVTEKVMKELEADHE